MEAKTKVLEFWPQLGDSSSGLVEYPSERKNPKIDQIFPMKTSSHDDNNVLTNVIISIISHMLLLQFTTT